MLKPLFFENSVLSLGRIAFWVVFVVSVNYWTLPLLGVSVPAMPSSLVDALAFLLMYNVAKKVNTTIEGKMKPKEG